MNYKPDPDRSLTLAEDRTVLAAERTFAAWLRTGLGFLASGLAAQRVLVEVAETWQLRILATVLLACAAFCFGAGAWRDARSRRRMPESEIHLMPRVLTVGISLMLALACLPAAFLVWLN